MAASSEALATTVHSYGSEKLQDLELLEPSSPGSADAPMLVFVHGGAWRTGDRTDVSSSLLPSLSHSTGLRIANINYRLSPAVTHPSHIQDLASALLTLPSSSHLILMGHSCGSFLISSLLFDHRHDKVTEALRSRIIGFIASEPIFDPADLLDEYPDYREFLKGAFGSEEAVRTQGAETNRWSGKGELKVLVSHTREDELLSLRQPIGLVQKLWSWSGKEGQWSDEERSFEGNGLNVEVDFYSVHGKHDDILQQKELPAQVTAWLKRHDFSAK